MNQTFTVALATIRNIITNYIHSDNAASKPEVEEWHRQLRDMISSIEEAYGMNGQVEKVDVKVLPHLRRPAHPTTAPAKPVRQESTPAVRLKITEMYSPAQITDTDPPASDQSPCNTHTLTTIPSTFSHQDRTGLAAAASGLSTKFGYTANFNLDNPLTHVCPYNLTTGKRCPAGSDCGFQRICCKRTKSPAMIAEHIAEDGCKVPAEWHIRPTCAGVREGKYCRPECTYGHDHFETRVQAVKENRAHSRWLRENGWYRPYSEGYGPK